MSGDDLPDHHSVCRLVKATQYEDGELQPAAFVLSEKDSDGLSVNWVEHVAEAREEALRQILTVLHSKRTVRPSQRFALLNVGEAKDSVRRRSDGNLDVTIQHAPEAPPDYSHLDPSHTLIANFTMADRMLVAEALVAVAQSTDPVGPNPTA